MATPVVTSWGLPESLRSMRAASPASLGFPIISPPQTTAVSAPMKKRSAVNPATARAFASASLRTPSWTLSSGRNASGMPLGIASTGIPADASSAARLGEADARMIFLAVCIPRVNLWALCGGELQGPGKLRDRGQRLGQRLAPVVYVRDEHAHAEGRILGDQRGRPRRVPPRPRGQQQVVHGATGFGDMALERRQAFAVLIGCQVERVPAITDFGDTP